MTDTIGIVGAGRMGTAIAQMYAQAGYNVVLVDVSGKFLINAVNSIGNALDQDVASGKINQQKKEEVISRLTSGTDFSLLKNCAVCLEIVLENDHIKSFIHAKIREKAGQDIVIASNTATLPVKPMAKRVDSPQNFLGITFGFPPQTAPEVKIIPGPHASQAAIDSVINCLRAIGKTPMIIKDRKGPFRFSLTAQVWAYLATMTLTFVMWETAVWLDLSPAASQAAAIIGSITGLSATVYFSYLLMALFNRQSKLTHAMTGLAANDLSITVPLLDRQDECGDIARIVDILKKITLEVNRLAEEESKKMKADADKRVFLEKLTGEFEQNVGQIVNDVAAEALQLQSNAKHLSEMSDQTNRQSSTVAAATEEASASVQTVASAAEELSASIGEINRQVSESSRVAAGAVEEVKHTNETVSTLSEAAAQIGDVVKLIQDIAEQTNLLALNATIEAARAGEAGKGFAVVASEVKNLANQTARATEEISNKIVTVQTVSTEAVSAIRNIGVTIDKMSEISGIIANAIQQQTSATKEIANNVQQASAGTNEVSSSIITVTHAASESGKAAGEVLQASGQLSQQADRLQKEVQSFLSRVKQN